MISYFLEFAIIHLVLYTLYRLFLSRETQLGLLRIYLIFSNVLALSIPFIELPNYIPIANINITQSVSNIILPEVVIGGSANQSWWHTFTVSEWVIVSIALMISFKLIWSLVHILIIYLKSEPADVSDYRVRHVPNLKSSFTFFSLIFIDQQEIKGLNNIITHEQAHVRYGHSYDLFFFNLLTIPFWWVPSIWLAIRDLKRLHEYQADAYALKTLSFNNYRSTLINNTLYSSGLAITNSFNDTPITKRLDFMKKLKKDINPWKLTSLIAILLIVGYTFSCQSQIADPKIDGEVYTEVDEMPKPNGGMNAFYKYLQENIKYPAEAKKANIEGKVIVEFVVLKDGSIANSNVKAGLGYGCDKEAVRMVENSGTWVPGKLDGKKVNTKLVLPIVFKLGNGSKTNVDEGYAEAKGEEMPTYPGGINSFFHYVQENINMPVEAKDANVEGKVFIEFTVDKDGSVIDASIKRGIGYGCDEEALRVVKNSPDWTPVTKDGKAVATKMTLPIFFKSN